MIKIVSLFITLPSIHSVSFDSCYLLLQLFILKRQFLILQVFFVLGQVIVCALKNLLEFLNNIWLQCNMQKVVI